MKDYNRLTTRVGNSVSVKATSSNDNKSIWNAIERLAELEDKIEQGKMLELPCKVGDTVWEIFYSKYEERILELEVTQIVMHETISYRCKTKTRCLYSYGWVKNEDFGKTVFLTKAEAEQKLKQLQGDK
jgi:hypothetical protein